MFIMHIFPHLLVILSLLAVIYSLTDEKAYVFTNVFTGPDYVLEYNLSVDTSDITLSSIFLNDIPGSTGLTTLDLWEIVTNYDGTVSIYNSNNRNNRLDVHRNGEVPFMAPVGSTNAGQVWQLTQWTDQTWKIYNKEWAKNLDQSNGIPFMATPAQDGDTGRLGQHWNILDAYPTITVTSIQTEIQPTFVGPETVTVTAAAQTAVFTVAQVQTTTITSIPPPILLFPRDPNSLLDFDSDLHPELEKRYSLLSYYDTVTLTTTEFSYEGGGTVYVTVAAAEALQTTTVTSTTSTTVLETTSSDPTSTTPETSVVAASGTASTNKITETVVSTTTATAAGKNGARHATKVESGILTTLVVISYALTQWI